MSVPRFWHTSKKRQEDDPWGILKSFGIQSSRQVGQIVEALHANKKTRVVKKLVVDVDEYADLFSENEPFVRLHLVRWLEEECDDSFPQIQETHHILRRHFGNIPFDSLVISKRRFPEHMRADIQIALEQAFTAYPEMQLFGLNSRRTHEGVDFRALTETDEHHTTKIGPLTFSEISIGQDEVVSCQSNGLWLTRQQQTPFAVVLGSAAAYRRDGAGVQIEVAIPDDESSREFASGFFDKLQRCVEDSRCFRGKILSFEHTEDYQGRSAEVKVHELKKVTREEVILPQQTRELLDRNVIDFVRQRPELKKRGMNLKKGLLLFGPPGTGKTHTVHYLSRALPATTTLIITSEQIGLLSKYMTLARLLQPSLVIIEDADLIARQREDMNTCEEVLLNKLLNEMDGLRADAEIIFILTTNRPEALEMALTARPGRIDQAIEFPLPDDVGRQQLAQLYAGNQHLAEDVRDTIVRKTENTSAAFIKELMRRATQYAIVRGNDESICESDVETAVEEMLFSGGAFNRQILGVADAASD